MKEDRQKAGRGAAKTQEQKAKQRENVREKERQGMMETDNICTDNLKTVSLLPEAVSG